MDLFFSCSSSSHGGFCFFDPYFPLCPRLRLSSSVCHCRGRLDGWAAARAASRGEKRKLGETCMHEMIILLPCISTTTTAAVAAAALGGGGTGGLRFRKRAQRYRTRACFPLAPPTLSHSLSLSFPPFSYIYIHFSMHFLLMPNSTQKTKTHAHALLSLPPLLFRSRFQSASES